MATQKHQHHPVAQALSVLVGATTTAQSRVNGQLATELGSGLQAALVSFSTGLLLLAAYALCVPKVRRGVTLVIAAVRAGELPWWQTVGGLVGASFVAVQSFSVPLIGVAIFTIAIVGAQTASSLAVDRLGLGPQGKLHLTGNRVAAAVIAVSAVGVAVSDRITGAGFAFWAVIAALIVGTAISFQHAFNGHVRAAAQNPVTAALINFMGGTTLLGLVFAAALAAHLLTWQPLPAGPFWLYLGGLFGLVFIVTASHVIRFLGSLRFALGSVAGQLAGSLLLDLLAPTAGTSISAHLLTGVAMTALAVLIANRTPR